MKIEIEITEQEIKAIKVIRNYFGEHDKTPLEHMAYNELDRLVKKLRQPPVIGELPCDHEWKSRFSMTKGYWRLCCKCKAES